jgi:phosphomannomutase/phosphoglucomutase
VIAEAKCSQVLYDEIVRLGGQGVMWKTGHWSSARMKELAAPLGGEMSGHVLRHRYYDTMTPCASCRVIELLVRQRPLSELGAFAPDRGHA